MICRSETRNKFRQLFYYFISRTLIVLLLFPSYIFVRYLVLCLIITRTTSRIHPMHSHTNFFPSCTVVRHQLDHNVHQGLYFLNIKEYTSADHLFGECCLELTEMLLTDSAILFILFIITISSSSAHKRNLLAEMVDITTVFATVRHYPTLYSRTEDLIIYQRRLR